MMCSVMRVMIIQAVVSFRFMVYFWWVFWWVFLGWGCLGFVVFVGFVGFVSLYLRCGFLRVIGFLRKIDVYPELSFNPMGTCRRMLVYGFKKNIVYEDFEWC